MPTKKETKTKGSLLDFFNYHSKKFIITVSAIALLALASSFAIWYMNKNSDVVAVIDGKEITRKAYNSEVDQCKAGLNFDGQKDLSSCDKTAVENLIYYTALKSEASKYGVDVSSDVDKQYTELKNGYSTEAEFLATYKTQFGESPEDVRRNLEVGALEDALTDKLITKMTIEGAFVRWDNFQITDGVDAAKNNATALVQKYLENVVKTGGSRDEIQAAVEKLRKENPKYDNQTKTLAGYDKIEGLNQKNYSQYFDQNKDWEEFSKLAKVGDATEVYVSPAGSAKIMRLVSQNNGSYSSWDDFKKQILDKAQVSLVNYNFNKFIATPVTNNFNKAVAFVGKTLGIKSAFADCSTHLRSFIVNAIWYKGTSIHAGNIDYSYNQTSGYTGCTDGCSTATCSGSSNNADDSFWITGRNCMTRWDVYFSSHNGKFWPVRYINRGFYSNDYNENIDYDLVGHDAYAQYQDGSHTSWSTAVRVDSNSDDLGNNNGNIYVAPRVYTLTVNVSPNVATSTGDGSYKSYETATASYTNLNSNYEPDYYTRDDSPTVHRTGTSVGVSMTRNWTITFYFKPKAPTCRLSASSTSIHPGESSTLSWTTTYANSVGTPNPTGWTTQTVANGSQSVSPTASTTYNLKATGAGGTVDCTPITVAVTSVPPTACSITSFTANPATGTVPVNVSFAATAASAVSTSHSYDGEAATAGAPTSHSYSVAGIHTARFSCIGTDGAEHSQPVTINVSPASTCSINSATAAPASGNAPLSVNFNGTYTNTYPDPIEFMWNFPGGSPISRAWNSLITAATTYNTANSYTATLYGRLNDGFGTSCGNKTTSTITAVNPPYISCNVTPTDGLAPLTVKVTWSTNKETPTFNMKDGSANVTKPTPFYYTYSNSGTYKIEATNSAGSYICTTQDGAQNGVNVTNPSSGSGGEITPRQ